MSIRAFDYDAYWRDESRDDWRRQGLHWHCHASRMDTSAYGDEQARRDASSELAPREVRDWLRKPSRTIQHVPVTPEDAVTWLRGQWEQVKGQVGQEAAAIPDETRFGTALYNLRCGNDLCLGFWLNSSIHLHLAVIGTAQPCHGEAAG